MLEIGKLFQGGNMPIFFPIDDPTGQLEARLKTLIELKFGALFNHQLFLQKFNRDIQLLENFILKPPSEEELYNAIYIKQEAYNTTLQEGQARWDSSGKAIDVGTRTIHELSLRTKEFNAAKKEHELYQEKKLFIQNITTCDEVWLQFRELIRKLPDSEREKATHDILTLQKYWKLQGELANFNSNDLDVLEQEVKKFRELFDFMLSVLPVTPENDLDRELSSAFSKNNAALEQLKEKMAAVMAWKIKAASKKKCMWVDDHFSALFQDLKELFQVVPDGERDKTLSYFKIAANSRSRHFTPDKFIRYLGQIEKTSTWRGFALQSYWANESETFIIPIAMRLHYAVPAALTSYIPDELGWSPDARLRYRYFRDPKQHVMQINECVREIKLLREGIALASSLKLESLTDTPGFKSAMMIRSILEKERKRANYHKPSWTMGILFQYIPFINRFKLYQLITQWLGQLDEVELAVNEAGQDIAHVLMNRMGGELLIAIKEKSNLFPSNLVRDVRQFVKWYGNEEDNQLLEKLFQPLYLFSRFQFLKPKKSGYQREIDIESISMFLNFAERFWSEPEYRAAKLLVQMIKGEWFPTNLDEERYLAQMITPLLPLKERGHHFKELMETISQKYVDKTVDRGNEAAYHFLQRYSPNIAARWRQDRQENIDKKYILINQLLSDRPGDEVDLYDEIAMKRNEDGLIIAHFVQYLRDLKREGKDNHLNYLGALSRRAREYVENFKGENARYAELIIELATLSDDNDLVNEYVQKRMQNYVKKILSNENVELSNLDQLLFHGVRFRSVINQCFMSAIDQLGCRLESPQLFDWIESSCDLCVREHFRVKRIERLLDDNNLKKTESYAKSLLKYAKGAEYGELVSTNLGKQKLQKIYTRYLEKMSKIDDWQGNAFVIMASFRTHLGNQNIEYLNYLWLREYLLYPEHFDPDYDGERSTLDYKFHVNNLNVPDDDTSLTTFYGGNISFVKPLIIRYLQNFGPDRSAEQLPLIRTYLEEPEFKTDADTIALRRMLRAVEIMNAVYQNFKISDFGKISELISDLMAHYQAIIDLGQLNANADRLAETIYFQKLLDRFGSAFLNFYQVAIMPPTSFQTILRDPKKAFIWGNDVIHDAIPYDVLLPSLREKLIFFRDNVESAIQIVKALADPDLKSINLDADQAQILSKVLPQAYKDQLIAHIKQIFTCFRSDDDQHRAAASYTRIIDGSYDESDLLNLKRYKIIKRDQYPKMAKQVMNALLEAMISNKSIIEIFNLEAHSSRFYDILAHHLDSSSVAQLSEALSQKIKVMLEDAYPLQKEDWLTHGAVYKWLLVRGCSLQLKVESKVADRIKYLSFNLMKPENEAHIRRAALFIRAFGDDAAIKTLETLLDRLSFNQRQRTLNSRSDQASVQFIEYVNRMMLLVGRDDHIKRSVDLIKSWSKFREYSSNLLSDQQIASSQEMALREEIISSAFDICLDELEKNCFQYFMDSYRIEDETRFWDDYESMLLKFKSENLVDGCYIQINDIIKKYGYDYFQSFIESHQASAPISLPHAQQGREEHTLTSLDGLKLLATMSFCVRALQAKEAWREQLQVDREGALMKFNENGVMERLQLMKAELIEGFRIKSQDYVKQLDRAIGASIKQFEVLKERLVVEDNDSDHHVYRWVSGFFSRPSL